MVLVEFPCRGSYVFGMLIGERVEPLEDRFGEGVNQLFSGWVFFASKERPTPAHLYVGGGTTLVLSSGLAKPKERKVADSQG